MIEHGNFVTVLEEIALIGGGLSVIGYAIKRVYNTARGVEKILEFTVEEKSSREKLAQELKDHIEREDTRDELRDRQLIQLVDNVNDIVREVRPNGGSSMKDTLTAIEHQLHGIQKQVSVLEEWKKHVEVKKAPKKRTRA